MFAKVKKGVQKFMQSSVDLEELAQNAETLETRSNPLTGGSNHDQQHVLQYKPIENQEIKVRGFDQR